jgi:signal transduction histidine kinase
MVQNTPIYTTIIVIVGCAVILFFVIFFYLLIIQLHKRRILHEKEMFDLTSQYERTILQSQLEIQEQTFRNISQEIHDNIGQVLSLAKLNLNTIPHDAQNGTSEKIALAEELLGKAIGDLRDLSKSLHPEKIVDIGLTNAIRHELQLVQKTAKLSTEMLSEEEIKLSNEKSIIIFRMIQEILHNIIKHARAKNVTLAIKTKEDKTIIEVKDNGRGFDLANLKGTETGIGLKSIQQRCALINASCDIQTMPGMGTSVQLIIQNN